MSSSSSFRIPAESSSPELLPIADDNAVVPPSKASQLQTLKAIRRGRAVNLTSSEFEFFVSNLFIRRMPPHIESHFKVLPSMITEVLDLGGEAADIKNLVSPIVKAFRLNIESRIPESIRSVGLVALAKRPAEHGNHSIRPWIRQAKANAQRNRVRFLELWLELKSICPALLRYRNNHHSYVETGIARARITTEGLAQLRLLELEQQIFGD